VESQSIALAELHHSGSFIHMDFPVLNINKNRLSTFSLKKHAIATPGRDVNAGQATAVPHLLLIKHSFSPLAPPAAD
jgi:hypothetical protein